MAPWEMSCGSEIVLDASRVFTDLPRLSPVTCHHGQMKEGHEVA